MSLSIRCKESTGYCSHQFNSSYDYLHGHLSSDEFKGVERTLHFICLDAHKQEVGQILRTHYKKQLLPIFKRPAKKTDSLNCR